MASSIKTVPATHKQAVRIVAGWLRVSIRCRVVVAELTTANRETPDAIGFRTGGRSILVEVKMSRSDFLADREKIFRQVPSAGMGDERYFAAPKGMLKPDDLPENWGLIEFEGRRVVSQISAKPQEANKRAEVSFLTSAMSRLELATAVFVRQDADADVDADASTGLDASPLAAGP